MLWIQHALAALAAELRGGQEGHGGALQLAMTLPQHANLLVAVVSAPRLLDPAMPVCPRLQTGRRCMTCSGCRRRVCLSWLPPTTR